MSAAVAAGVSPCPVTFEVEYPERLSRWLIFVKWLLVIPHAVVLYFLQLVTGVLTFFAFFAILFTGKFPRGMFDFNVNVYRWQANVSAYAGLLRDEYPPFSGEPGRYPVTFDVRYPERLSRWLIFVKWLLVIPNLVVLLLLALVAAVLYVLAFFAILFGGKFPRGMFHFIVGVNRWSYRANAYGAWLMTDRYPPFSLT
jgi:membrane protein YqaA with SNARE-associated domain